MSVPTACIAAACACICVVRGNILVVARVCFYFSPATAVKLSQWLSVQCDDSLSGLLDGTVTLATATMTAKVYECMFRLEQNQQQQRKFGMMIIVCAHHKCATSTVYSVVAWHSNNHG